ncbi:MAG: hypothetical protein HQK51_16575 [Oligoflexia bacterium]|nr:hypothetical protein [Oligoflexia bacterium]
MLVRHLCPECFTTNYINYGKSKNGKQNNLCKDCGRAFVSFLDKELANSKIPVVNKLLLEKISLRGICRSMDVTKKWLLKHISKLFKIQPNDLNVNISRERIYKEKKQKLIISSNRIEADEMWSFVQNKKNEQWI